MITQDYLMRMLQKLAEGLARIAKKQQAAQYEEAQDELEDCCEDLLGHQPHMLEMLDPRNTARMLGSWPKIRIYAALIRAEAELNAAAGNDPRAALLHRRALTVYLEGVDRGGRGDPDLRDTLAELLKPVGLQSLSPGYQTLIRELRP